MSVLTEVREPATDRRPDRPAALAAQLRAGQWHVSAMVAVAVLLGSVSLGSLLDGGWWFPRTAIVVAVIAAVGALARSLRVAAALIPLLQFGSQLLAMTLLFARDEAVWGALPGSAALGRLQELASQGRDYAVATRPPAGPDEGLLLLIVAAVGLTALAVDTLAAGLDLPGMSLIPLAALFLVPWTISGGGASGWAFAAVAVGWLGILSALQSDRAARWSPGAHAGSPGAGLAIAGATTALALLAGGMTTLRGPEGPDIGGTGAGAGAVQLDALVSMRRSLVSSDPRPIMSLTTTASQPEYLRLAILERFDGEQWSAAGPNPTGSAAPVNADGEAIEYQLDIGPLAGSTVPSPSGTYRVLNDWPVVWDQRTTLPRRADGSGVQDTTVDLTAVDRGFGPDELRARSSLRASPPGVHPDNLADPSPLTGNRLPRLARSITAGADTPFDAAIALQRWFTTDGGFQYSTQIVGGSGGDALDDFLTERVGYCEQFAATMALMARSVGIAARVAVGFTHGRPDAGQWIVRGTDAHAWPELWMGAAGWVRFEPTPGAATASIPPYTRDGDAGQDPTQGRDEESPGSAADPGTAAGPQPELADDAIGAAPGAPGIWLPARLLAVLVLVAASVPVVVRHARRRRRTRRGDADAAYEEVVDTMVDLRLGDESATPRTTMALVAHVISEPGTTERTAGVAGALSALQRIQQAVERQRYGTPPQSDPSESGVGTAGAGVRTIVPGTQADATRPAADAATVRRQLYRRATWPRRFLAVAAPRSVVAPRLGRGATRGDSVPG